MSATSIWSKEIWELERSLSSSLSGPAGSINSTIGVAFLKYSLEEPAESFVILEVLLALG